MNETEINYSDLEPGHGLQSIADCSLTPDQILMAREAPPEPHAERVEIFGRMLLHIHAGSIQPGQWARRAYALARQHRPSLIASEAGDAADWLAWTCRIDAKAEAGVAAIMARLEADGQDVWQAQGLTRQDWPAMREVCPPGNPAIRPMLDEIWADGCLPDAVAKRTAAYALAFRPTLLCNATCAEIAALFGQGRAAVSHRVRRVVNDRIAAAGGVAHLAFQKSASAVSRYSEAAKGNRNRAKH